MTLSIFNNLDKETAAKKLFSCCGSRKWVSFMMEAFPFQSGKTMVEKATTAWFNECGKEDWLESFTHHPKIGDKKSLFEKFAGKEQASVASAPEEIIEALAKANKEYEKKFGFIFIVFATGKSAIEMLQLLNDRLKNDMETELNIAMAEQHKITLLRFKKIIDKANF